MEPHNPTNPQRAPEHEGAPPGTHPNEASTHHVSPPPSPSPFLPRPVSPEDTRLEVAEVADAEDVNVEAISPVSSISSETQSLPILARASSDLTRPPAAERTSPSQSPRQLAQAPAVATPEGPTLPLPAGQVRAERHQGSTPGEPTRTAPPTSNPPPPSAPEIIPYGRWRPGYLRKSILVSFLCIFLVLLAAVETIFFVSESRNGLEEANESLSWLWTFSPTIAMTVLASLWLRVEYQAMRYSPWIRLSRWGAAPSPKQKSRRSALRTILVDYPNMSPLIAVWKAAKFGDHLVTAAVVVSFVIYIQITISTGLINSEPRQFEEAISVLVEDTLTTVGRDDGRASLPMVAVNGMVALNMTIPNGHAGKHAFEWFSPSPDLGPRSFSAFAAPVGVASIDVQCEVPSIEDPTNPLASDSLFLQFKGNYCTSRQLIVQIQAQNSPPVPEGRSYFWIYDERAACQDNTRGIVVAAVVAIDRNGDNLTYVSSSRVMCSVGLAFGNATVKTVNGKPEISSLSMGDRVQDVDILSEIQFHRLDNTRSGSDLQENTGPHYTSELQLSPFRVGARLLPGGPPDVTALLEHTTLQETITAWLQHFGAILLHYNHRSPGQRVTTGQVSTIRDRLVVNKNVAHGMAGGFALMALMAAWMLFNAPPGSGFVPRDPDTISGSAVLLSKSSELLSALHGTGRRTIKEITMQVSGTYRTVIQPSPDNALSPSFFLKKDDPAPSQGPEPRQTSNVQSSDFRPWSPKGLRAPIRWISLAAMVAIGVASGVLLSRSNQTHGFFNTGDNPNIQYLWTILPTLIMEALTIYVKGTDFSIRALAPFAALQSRTDTFERALAISYTNELGPATIRKALGRKDWPVVVAKTMAIICTLLPIITNALFSVENLEIQAEVQLQQQTWFGSADYETASWEAPSHVADMLLRSNVNSTFPPWSFNEWAFHSQVPLGNDIASADPTDLSVKARLPAVSVGLDCELSLRPGPIRATGGVILEVDGRNTTCFSEFSCSKHRYFGGSIGGHYLSYACSPDLSPTTYAWGHCTGDTLDFIAQLACSETAIEQYFDVTLSGPDLSLDTTNEPPVPVPDTTRPHDFHGNISDIYIALLPGDNFAEGPTDAYLDRFFRSLVTGKLSLPLSDFESQTTAESVVAAIKKQHAIIRAQTLSYDGRSEIAVTRAIRLRFDDGTNQTKAQYPPFTAAQPAPQPATLHHSPNRLVQSPTATYIIIGVLSVVFVLNLTSIVITKKIQMPKSPGSIAAIASLLADSTIFKHLPSEGVEWMSDEELARHFRGRGVTFKMDWFGSGGARYYTIGVVEDEVVELVAVGSGGVGEAGGGGGSLSRLAVDGGGESVGEDGEGSYDRSYDVFPKCARLCYGCADFEWSLGHVSPQYKPGLHCKDALDDVSPSHVAIYACLEAQCSPGATMRARGVWLRACVQENAFNVTETERNEMEDGLDRFEAISYMMSPLDIGSEFVWKRLKRLSLFGPGVMMAWQIAVLAYPIMAAFKVVSWTWNNDVPSGDAKGLSEDGQFQLLSDVAIIQTPLVIIKNLINPAVLLLSPPQSLQFPYTVVLARRVSYRRRLVLFALSLCVVAVAQLWAFFLSAHLSPSGFIPGSLGVFHPSKIIDMARYISGLDFAMQHPWWAGQSGFFVIARLYGSLWSSGLETLMVPPGQVEILNGTIQEVVAQAIAINPEYKLADVAPEPAPAAKPRRALSGREVKFCNNFGTAGVDAIIDGVNYLRGVGGKPTLGPGPTVLILRMQNTGSKTVTWDGIANSAKHITEVCPWYWAPSNKAYVSGQNFKASKWNTLVKEDRC
ncbi:hypothetical protein B0T16DRAFT_506731 [Cercophora newfieldiana]|uniref:Uncharacterized protein n=1 Tax=Cercophora newfieldiana TaxID=92897 RepID=A0AA40CR70_9PEZI|nr:hypothetical protein B0T16DRAFT_506731 [Cercophora newfieldiana]